MSDLNTKYHWERFPIDQAGYEKAIHLHVSGSIELAHRMLNSVRDPINSIETLMKAMLNSTRLGWELTRPGSYALIANMSRVLHTDEMIQLGVLAHVKGVWVRVFVGEDDEVLAASAYCTKEADPNSEMVPITGLDEEIANRLKAAVHDAYDCLPAGVDRSKAKSIDDALRETIEESFTKEIDDFREEMDSLFETWGGGDTT